MRVPARRQGRRLPASSPIAHHFPALLGQLTDAQLLELGKRGASTDVAVRFFNDKHHRQFYHHRPSLLRAVRRAMEVNFPDTKAAMRQRVIEMLDLDRPETDPLEESKYQIPGSID